MLSKIAPPETSDQFELEEPVIAQASEKKSRRKSVDKIIDQPGFVLHAWPYKETSLLIDVFSRNHGRLSLLAKGAKRPFSQLRGVLHTFQPLRLGWSGKAEIKTLTQAEWVAGLLPLERQALISGYYLNELLLKLLVKDEPQTELFEQYLLALTSLAQGIDANQVLRQFELQLLRAGGLLGDICWCQQSQAKVQPEQVYVLDPQTGTRLARHDEYLPKVHGQTLINLSLADMSDARTQQESKLLMRYLLGYHLNGKQLSTRQILLDLQKL